MPEACTRVVKCKIVKKSRAKCKTRRAGKRHAPTIVEKCATTKRVLLLFHPLLCFLIARARTRTRNCLRVFLFSPKKGDVFFFHVCVWIWKQFAGSNVDKVERWKMGVWVLLSISGFKSIKRADSIKHLHFAIIYCCCCCRCQRRRYRWYVDVVVCTHRARFFRHRLFQRVQRHIYRVQGMKQYPGAEYTLK